MLPNLPLSKDELTRCLLASGENRNIDAKGPIVWDGADNSASLAKDIVAFANSRDGGLVILGKRESTPGEFEFVGVSEEEAGSFDTTKVATWINNRFSPPIRLVCHRHEYEGRTFIIIAIEEFEDVPAICTREYQSQSQSGRTVLRSGDIFVRNDNAESVPIRSPDSLRQLIGVAVAKRRVEFGEMLSAIIAGKPIVPPAPRVDQYASLLDDMTRSLAVDAKGKRLRYFWRRYVHPIEYQEGRFSDDQLIGDQIKKSVVRFRDTFPTPYVQSGTKNWGIVHFDPLGGGYAMSHSGAFLVVVPFEEDLQNYPAHRGYGGSDEPIAAGKWLELEWNLHSLIEFFIFASRFGTGFEPSSELRVALHARGLQGRRLVTHIHRAAFRPSDPCLESEFAYDRTFRVGALESDWKNICKDALARFFRLFDSFGAFTPEFFGREIERIVKNKF